MFSPFKVPGFYDKILSIYISTTPLNAGAIVDVDPNNTIAFGANASVGYNSLIAGGLTLATLAPADSTHFGRELGIAIPSVNLTGPTLQERLLELASSYMTVPVGAACSVMVTSPGDIIATTEFVGYLPADSGATGALDITDATNKYAELGVFQGRFRKAQGGDAVRARYLGNTTVNGTLVPFVQMA